MRKYHKFLEDEKELDKFIQLIQAGVRLERDEVFFFSDYEP